MLAGRDHTAPDTSDLILQRPVVPSENNAYTFFAAATNTFYWPKDSAFILWYLRGYSVDNLHVREIIARNAETMGVVEKGLSCRTCQMPEITRFDTPRPDTSKLHNIGRVMALKARHERLAGSPELATDTCLSLLRIGELLQHDAESINDYLLGITVLELGLQQAMEIARDDATSMDDLSRMSTALSKLGPFDHGLARGIRGDYIVADSFIDEFSNGTISMADVLYPPGAHYPKIMDARRIPFFLQPNRTKAMIARAQRQMLANVPLVYAEITLRDPVLAPKWYKDRLKLYTRPNAVGKMLYDLLRPHLDLVFEQKCRVECDLAAARLLAAISAYERKTGGVPNSLVDLAPHYISAIPQDAFDGMPFRYDSSHSILYSVGKDLKDSGGYSSLPAGEREGADVSWRSSWGAADIVYSVNKKVEPIPVPVSDYGSFQGEFEHNFPFPPD